MGVGITNEDDDEDNDDDPVIIGAHMKFGRDPVLAEEEIKLGAGLALGLDDGPVYTLLATEELKLGRDVDPPKLNDKLDDDGVISISIIEDELELDILLVPEKIFFVFAKAARNSQQVSSCEWERSITGAGRFVGRISTT